MPGGKIPGVNADLFGPGLSPVAESSPRPDPKGLIELAPPTSPHPALGPGRVPREGDTRLPGPSRRRRELPIDPFNNPPK